MEPFTLTYDEWQTAPAAGTPVPFPINRALLAELVRTVGLTPRELSADIRRKTGVSVSPSLVSRMTSHGAEELSLPVDTLRAVAEYFGVAVGDLALPRYGSGEVEAAIAGASDLADADKALLLELYRRLRK